MEEIFPSPGIEDYEVNKVNIEIWRKNFLSAKHSDNEKHSI